MWRFLYVSQFVCDGLLQYEESESKYHFTTIHGNQEKQIGKNVKTWLCLVGVRLKWIVWHLFVRQFCDASVTIVWGSSVRKFMKTFDILVTTLTNCDTLWHFVTFFRSPFRWRSSNWVHWMSPFLLCNPKNNNCLNRKKLKFDKLITSQKVLGLLQA